LQKADFLTKTLKPKVFEKNRNSPIVRKDYASLKREKVKRRPNIYDCQRVLSRICVTQNSDSLLTPTINTKMNYSQVSTTDGGYLRELETRELQ
jgi:hypothetical protein